MAKQLGRHRRPKENAAKQAVLRQGGRALAVSAIGLGVVTLSTQTAAAEEVPAAQAATEPTADQRAAMELSAWLALASLGDGPAEKKYVDGQVTAENYYDQQSNQWVQSKEVGTEQWLNDKGEVVAEIPKENIQTFDQMAAVREDCSSGAANCQMKDEESLGVELGSPQQQSRAAFNCTNADSTQTVGWMVAGGKAKEKGGSAGVEIGAGPAKVSAGGRGGTTVSETMTDSGSTNVVLKPGETGWVGVATPQETVKGTMWTDYGSTGSDPWYSNGLEWGYEDQFTRPVADGTEGVYTALTSQSRPMTEEEKTNICGG